MNKSESKYFNTALRMDEALIELLEEKDLEYITVKEICQRAGVNRSTFYLHYETVADLVNETAEMVNRRFLSYFPQQKEELFRGVDSQEPEDLILVTREYLLPYLQTGLPGGLPKPRRHADRGAVRGAETVYPSPYSGAVCHPGGPPALLYRLLCGGHHGHRQGVAPEGLLR